MSESSSYRSYESENESNSRCSADNSTDDEDSDELTLLNGDGESDQDSTTFEAFIKLSMQLKEKYNLCEASVSLERCDKIWDTMQLLKKMQTNDGNYGSKTLINNGNIDKEDENDNDDKDDDNDDDDDGPAKSTTDSLRSESTSSSTIPYIKYQPVQGNGNNALPNFYLSVKSQKKVYHCVTCGRQFIERRALRRHTLKEHGIVLPYLSVVPPKRQIIGEPRVTRSKTPQNIENRDSHDANENKIPSQDSVSYTEWKKKRDSSLALSRSARQDVPKEKVYHCPKCSLSYNHSQSLQQHSIQVHGYDVTIKTDLPANCSKKPIEKKGKASNVKNIEEIRPDGTKILHGWRKRVKNGPYAQPLIFQCGTCRRDFCDMKTLRKHRLNIHNSVLPHNPSHSHKISSEPKNEHETKNEKSPTPENSSKKSKKLSISEEKEIPRSPTSRPTTRAGPKSSKCSIARPKRACTVNTSYTECTKEEEEVLQREIFSTKPPEKSSEKSVPSQQTKCVLCKRTFVDIRTHLKDYHRINSPDSVLTFTDKISSSKENAAVVTSNTIEQTIEDTKKAAIVTSSIDKKEVVVSSSVDKKEIVTSSRDDEMSKKLFYTVKWDETFYNYVFQCNVCLYKYSSLRTIQRHHAKFLHNGIMRPHEATKFVRVRIPGTNKYTYRNTAHLLQDPLALTNWPDNDDNASDSTNSEARKRPTSSSDERSSPIFSSFISKRRKIIDSETSEEPNNGSEMTNDSNHENHDGAVNINQTDFRTKDDDDDAEGKATNSRDTRDSSDRDSGIGISITIKKRNNSYEVVEKDIHDDDDDDDNKIKTGYAIATSLITPDCTSYTITNVEDYFNTNERVPHVGHETFDPLDCSVERDNVTTTTTQVMMEETTRAEMRINDRINDDDDITIIDEDDDDDVNCTDNENNFSGSNDECYSDEACTNMPGKVHSLKVLCRNVLRGGRISRFMSKDKFTHQCPVCCRFYPTERDVTVHMLQHKVSRTSFRTTRLHGIPSSALRRYGRRKTFE